MLAPQSPLDRHLFLPPACVRRQCTQRTLPRRQKDNRDTESTDAGSPGSPGSSGNEREESFVDADSTFVRDMSEADFGSWLVLGERGVRSGIAPSSHFGGAGFDPGAIGYFVTDFLASLQEGLGIIDRPPEPSLLSTSGGALKRSLWMQQLDQPAESWNIMELWHNGRSAQTPSKTAYTQVATEGAPPIAHAGTARSLRQQSAFF